MGHEDRERKFEQALARHLRGDAVGARNETDAHAAVPHESGKGAECLDAATLAALHEGMQSNSEMGAAKEHVAVCTRCQAILMQLKATAEIALEAEPQNILNARKAALSTGVSDVPHATRQTTGLTTTELASASKAPRDISRGRGFKALRWAAPAGAIAAGLLIWVVVRDNKAQTPSRSNNVQVAQEQPTNERLAAPRPSFPASTATEPVAKTKQLNGERKDNSRVKEPAEESGALRAPKRSSSAAITNEGDAVVSGASPRANVSQLPIESRNYASQSQLRAGVNQPPEISSSQADLSVTAAAPPVSGDPTAKSAAPTATKPASLSEASSNDAKQKADAENTYSTTQIADGVAPLANEQVATNDKLELPRSLKKDRYKNSKIVLALNGTVRWRLFPTGKIERSSDGGRTWSPQNSGVIVELLMGSAPSDTVCWIVGRGGIILKTTDGGGHWSKVAWPNGGEIIGIDGMDAMHAIVYEWTGVMPARLATNDGGESWFHTNK